MVSEALAAFSLGAGAALVGAAALGRVIYRWGYLRGEAQGIIRGYNVSGGGEPDGE